MPYNNIKEKNDYKLYTIQHLNLSSQTGHSEEP